MSIEHICCAYSTRTEVDDSSEGTKFGRPAFIKPVRLLTRGKQKRRSAVENMFGALVCDNVEGVIRIRERSR